MSRHHKTKWTGADSRKWRAIIEPTLPAPCCAARCVMGGVVYPGQLWDVGHRVGVADPRSSNDAVNLGPEHRKCNRSAGGKQGGAMTKKKRRDDERLVTW